MRSCDRGGVHGKAMQSECAYAPFGEAENVSAIRGPFCFYETFCAGLDVGGPSFIAKFEYLHDGSFGGGCKEIL